MRPRRQQAMAMSLALGITLGLVPQALAASSDTRDPRLGPGGHTTYALWRTTAGPNTISVNIGTPPTTFGVIPTTNAYYLALASTDCAGCLHNYPGFDYASSSTYEASSQHLEYSFDYPTPPSDTLDLEGVYANDVLGGSSSSSGSSVPLIATTKVSSTGARLLFPDQTYGWFGLGVDMFRPSWSLVHDTFTKAGTDGFTFGVDVAEWNNTEPNKAGEIHWGTVPEDTYIGDFQWLASNASTGWSVGIDSIAVNGKKISLDGYYATLDPAADEIAMPGDLIDTIAMRIGVSRTTGSTRFHLDCNKTIALTVTFGGVDYHVNPGGLTTSRWSGTSRSCTANLVAWQPASVPGERKEIRLGSAFLSSVYAAFYYSNEKHYVGLAGKNGTLNARDVSLEVSRTDSTVVAAVLGTLIPLLIIFLVVCFLRNRSTPESKYERRYREVQHSENRIRAHMDIPTMGAGIVPIVPVPVGPTIIPTPVPMAVGLPPGSTMPPAPVFSSSSGPVPGSVVQPVGLLMPPPPPMSQVPGPMPSLHPGTARGVHSSIYDAPLPPLPPPSAPPIIPASIPVSVMAPETHAPIEIAEDVPRLRPDAGRGIFARLFGRRGPRYRPVVNDHYADRVARLVADGVDRGHLYYGQPCTCCPPGTGHVPRLAPQTYEGYAGGIVAPKARYPRPRWAHSSYNPSLRRGAPTPSEIAYARAAAAEAAAHAPVPEPLVDAYYEQTGRRRERQQAYAEPEFVDYGQGQYDPTHLAPPGSVPPPPALSPGLGIPTPSATPGVPPLVPAPVPVPGPGGPNYRVPVTPEDYAREAARNALQAKERERQQRILDEIGARERAQQQQYQQQQPGPYQQSQYQPQYPQQHPPGYQQQPYQQGYPQQHQQDQWARTMAAERARTGPRQPEGPSRRGSRGAGARQAPMGVFSGAETPRRTAYDRRAAFDPKYRRG